MSNFMKYHKRHERAYKIVMTLVTPFLKWRFKIQSEPAPKIAGPYLVYANHNADLDPVLLQMSFKDMIYFVASEHIFRAGFASRLLVRYFDPISRLKGSSDMKTVREVIRRLKKGMRVCIFAEGNRSFNGLTCSIPSSTGKLAKLSGVPLVTYKFEGGYFTTPRWAYSLRRGRIRGYVVNVYSAEQLRTMSSDEINEAIAADLFEDAYARQAVEKIEFKGKRLAEGLETALFICPNCEQIDSLRSYNDEFSCECGLNGSYDEYGYLNNVPFTTVTEWDEWQQQQLAKIASNLGNKTAFTDNNIKLLSIKDDYKSELVDSGSGTLAMYHDRIGCGNLTFWINEISEMALYGRSNITFTCSNKHYVITSDSSFCGRKYLELYNLLKQI